MYPLLLYIDVSFVLITILFHLVWPAFIGLFIYQIIRGNNKAREAMELWAEENGWQLVEFSWQWRKGPFEEFRQRGDSYYRFVVSDNNGQKQTGWARYRYSLFKRLGPEIKWVRNAE